MPIKKQSNIMSTKKRPTKKPHTYSLEVTKVTKPLPYTVVTTVSLVYRKSTAEEICEDWYRIFYDDDSVTLRIIRDKDGKVCDWEATDSAPDDENRPFKGVKLSPKYRAKRCALIGK